MPDQSEEFRPALDNFARSRLPPRYKADAEDQVQTVFLQTIERQDGREKTRSFYMTAVRNQVFDLLREQNAQKRGSGNVVSLDTTDIFSEESEEPIDSLIMEEEVARVREALALLPTIQREAVEAHYFDQQSFSEIAERFGTNRNTVKSRIHSAHMFLRRHLSP